MAVEGEFLDTVIGMTGARTEIVMLRAPGGGTTLELSSFTVWRMAYVRGPEGIIVSLAERIEK
ncbi:hypothetical protein [Microbispora rosea]|uniref:hypothetical protein n=1 Tax=Microbispora rosea TaxID=58117 RepID=UPI00068966B5|nr:hypothetical protein [Microbispora rosea]